MGKATGLGAGFYLDGVDLSGDIGSLGRFNNARGLTDLTGIDVEAPERAHTHRDGGMEFQSWFNAAAGQSHPTLADPTTHGDRIATYLHRRTLGAPACFCVAKQADYGISRPDDASLTGSVAVESNGFGMEWGVLLTPGKETDSGAANGTGVDLAATTNFGLQAVLHVFSFTGTDATIAIQDSTDNVSFAAIPAASFTAVTTAPGRQRIQTARTEQVDRYLRAVTTTSGGFTNLVFAVIVRKNTILTNF
jgi:hypothetical protein